jgi:hypothetical protein
MLVRSSTLALALVAYVYMGGCDAQTQNEAEQEESQQQDNATQRRPPQRRGGTPMRPGGGQSADLEVSDEELTVFLEASQDMQKLQREAAQEMKAALRDEGMTPKTYRSRMKQMQNAQKGGEQGSSGLTKEEKQRFQKVQKEMRSIQQEARSDMQTTLKESGMKPKRFRQISQAVRRDSSLRGRLQDIQKQ